MEGNKMVEDQSHEELVKIRHEIEEIKDELRDQWHENREKYEKRVDNAIAGHTLRVRVFLAIDSIKSVIEIERELRAPHVSVWRSSEHLRKKGLIRKIGNKSGSPVYAKKPWVKELDLDDYVREKFPIKEQPPPSD